MRDFPSPKPSLRLRRRQSQGGQIVVEYVLLLIIAIGLALFITTRLVGRGDDGEGFVITKWKELIQAVAADKADDIQR